MPVTSPAGRDTPCILGNITELRGIIELMEAFASPKMNEGIRLTLGRSIRRRDPRAARSCHAGVAESRFLGMVQSPRRRTRSSVTPASGLITLRPAPNFTDALPVKLFEYMAAGLPVVISETIRASELVTEFDCGLAVNPLDPDAIAEAVSRIVDNPDLAQAMGRRGRDLVLERYQWINEARKLRNLYAQIA